MTTLDERVRRLEARNEALERQLRRWRRGGAAALAVVGVGLSLGLNRADDTDLRGRSLVLVDGAGKERLVLGIDVDGTGLVVKDGDGKERVELGMSKGGAGLVIKDGDGKERAGLGYDREGVGLSLKDGQGTMRVGLGAGKMEQVGEGAGLWIFDDKGRARLGVGAHGNGEGGLMMLDEQGKPVESKR